MQRCRSVSGIKEKEVRPLKPNRFPDRVDILPIVTILSANSILKKI